MGFGAHFGLALAAFVLIVANIIVFVTFSVSGANDELVFNIAGSVTTDTQFLIYTTYSLVYTYQLTWISYVLIQVIRSSDIELLVSKVTLSLVVLALVLQLVVNTVYILEVFFPLLVSLAFISLTAMFFSYKVLYGNRNIVAERNIRSEDARVRGLLHNGLDLYMTWHSYSAVICFGVLLETRVTSLNPSMVEAFLLVVIVVLNFFYVLTDLTIYDQYARYTLSPYILKLWVIGALIPFTKVVGLLILEALSVAFTLFALTWKFVLICRKSKVEPLVPRAMEPDNS